jgi:hypothetical protein
MPKMEKPKGKPTPEVQAQMKADKAARNEFLAGIMTRLSYGEKQKKQLERELDAAAAEAVEEVAENPYLNPPSGTRDFYPADKRVQNWLFSEFRSEDSSDSRSTTLQCSKAQHCTNVRRVRKSRSRCTISQTRRDMKSL